MTGEIIDLLETYHYRALQRMAEVAGLEADLRKDDLVAEMTANYFTGERIRSSVMCLDGRARGVLYRLLHLGGEMATVRLRQTLLDEGLVEEPSAPGRFRRGGVYGLGAPYAESNYVGTVSQLDSPVFEDVMARLTLHGLAFSRDPRNNYGGTPYKVRLHPAATIYVPEAVRRHLPDPEAGPLTPEAWKPDRVERGAPDVLLRDLYLTWDLVRRGDVRLIKSGFVGKRSLRAINETLLAQDTSLEDAQREDEATRLHLLRRLLEGLGLAERKGGFLCAVAPDDGLIPRFWAQSSGQQLLACLDVWQSMGGVSGLDSQVEVYSPRYAEARRILRATLADLGPDVWLEREDVLVAVQEAYEAFLFPERFGGQRLRRSPFQQAYGQPVAHGVPFFQRAELTFIEQCLRGFLHEAGVVELGVDGDTASRFKVTEAGHALLSGRTPADLEGQSDGGGKVVVQPTFDVIAMGPVGLDTLARLDICAERQRVDRAVFGYHLSRASLDQARRWGVTAAQVMVFLETKSETGLPQNVRRSIDGWARSQERFVFRRGVDLLEAAGDNELRALLDDPEIDQHLSRAVAPSVALVRDGQRGVLVAALAGRGFLPARASAEPASADDSVIVHEDGLIEAAHAVPGFQVRSRLAKLAEPDGDGTWRLTPASVRRAGGSRKRVLDLLDELGRLHRGQLPETVIRWIKAEGRYYGSANTETLTLIAFRDRQALEELREKDPDLASLLRPFRAGDRALAVVPTGRLSDVRERLAVFGVQVREERISGA